MTYLVQTAIPYFTGLPEDVAINTWHFNWINPGDPATANYISLCGDVAAFYAFVFNVTANVQLLSGICKPNLAVQKVYNLSDPEPRSPVYTDTAGIAAGTDVAFTTPLEVSLCLSYQGAKVSGFDQASRRGRIYLGPLGDLASTTGDPTHFPAPSSTWINRITTAAHQLTVDTIGHGWEWVVYSRKNNTSTAIVNGWVDNAWDTQRRRGNAPSTRTTWTAFLP